MEKSLYAQYVEERLDWDCFENEHGFIVWSERDNCYAIEEIFVKHSMRDKKFGSDLLEHVEKLAKDNKISYLAGTVWPHTKGATEVMIASIKNGWKIVSSHEGKIVITKKVY